MKRLHTLSALLFVVMALLAACGTPAASTGSSNGPSSTAAGGAVINAAPASGATKITLGAYSTPRDAYTKILPMFKKYWKDQSGQDVSFEESYLGSGAQSRAIVQGFDADVAALSLEEDISRIAKAGLITHDWKAGPTQGMVQTSVVAFAVRKGNPKGIKDWADLAKPGINVLMPNPKTSGGAQWNVMAMYGAALRGHVAGVAQGDSSAATEFMKKVLKNISVMDKDGRSSITTFEKGIGDVAITYESEVVIAQQSGGSVELVLPTSTLLIESPIALVDMYVNKHGNRKVVEAFINYLFGAEAQKVFAATGNRSVDKSVAQATASQYPPVQDLFTSKDLGGWTAITPKFFGDAGIYTKGIAEVQH